jgi:glycosyltransferase involved in cell wall biosynthesis
MARLRIAIPVISLSAHGGVRILVALANYLARQDCEVTILLPAGRMTSPYPVAPAVGVKECGVRIKSKAVSYALFLATLPFYLRHYDVAVPNFFPTFFPSVAAKALFGTKFVYFIQDVESKYKGGPGSILNKLCLLTYRHNDHAVAANKYLAGALERISAKPFRYINIGLSEQFFVPGPAGAEKAFDVLYFLRAEPWKQKDVFFSLLKDLRKIRPDLRTLCVSQDEQLLQVAAEAGCSTVKPRDDSSLIAAIDSAKVMVMTSSLEGFSLPPLECMARGVPAVTLECGGPSSYIRNGSNSYIVDDPAGLVDKTQYLLSHCNEYAIMSSAAKLDAATFRNDRGMHELYVMLKEECASH